MQLLTTLSPVWRAECQSCAWMGDYSEQLATIQDQARQHAHYHDHPVAILRASEPA